MTSGGMWPTEWKTTDFHRAPYWVLKRWTAVSWLPVDETPPCGEGGINKAPFGSYKGFFHDNSQQNQACWSLRVQWSLQWSANAHLLYGGLPHKWRATGSIQPAGCAMSGGWLQPGSSALVSACMFLYLVPWVTHCCEAYLLEGSFQGASCTCMVGDKGVPWPSTVLTVLG